MILTTTKSLITTEPTHGNKIRLALPLVVAEGQLPDRIQIIEGTLMATD